MSDGQFKQDRLISQEKGSRVFRRSLMITAVLALLAIVGLFISLTYTNTDVIDQFIHSARPWLACWRLLLFLLLICGWSFWSELYATWTRMNNEQLQRILDYRWRIAVWLLVMEAVLTQRVLTDFVNDIVATMNTE